MISAGSKPADDLALAHKKEKAPRSKARGFSFVSPSQSWALTWRWKSAESLTL